MRKITIALLLSLCLLFSFQAHGQVTAKSAGGSPAVTETATTYTITKTNIVLAGAVTVSSISFTTVVATTSITVGDDVLNKDGAVIWIDADGGTGNATIASDKLTFSGFSGGVDIDGAATATSFTADAGLVGTSLFPAVTNVGTIGDVTTIWNTGTLGTLTLGDDSDNVNGTLNFIAVDGDAGNISINTSDKLVLGSFSMIQIGGSAGLEKTTSFTIQTTGTGDDILIDANIGGAAETDIGVSGDGDILNIYGAMKQDVYVIRKHVSITGQADDNVSAFFTITTADETGSADGGSYSVKVHLVASEAVAASGATNVSSMSGIYAFSRVMQSAGTGANSVVAEVLENAGADAGTGAIVSIDVTVAETSEFVQTISLQVDTSGGTFSGFAIVEVVYSVFTTAPVIG